VPESLHAAVEPATATRIIHRVTIMGRTIYVARLEVNELRLAVAVGERAGRFESHIEATSRE
jgi:hypothetical protein